MNLRKIIVHEIQKNTGENETEITLSDELIPNDGQSSSLVSSLLRSYRGDKILYAVFEDEEGHYFPPKNVPIINTNDRQSFPFVSEDGTLYFSSNASYKNKLGFGLMDIYKVKNIPEEFKLPEFVYPRRFMHMAVSTLGTSFADALKIATNSPMSTALR